MTGPNESGASNEAVLCAVLSAWAVDLETAAVAFREHFTDDCVWDQGRTLPVTTGPEEAAQLWLGLGARGIATVEAEHRNVVVDGDVICTERVDHVVLADGSRARSVPTVAFHEFRDGKICAWREYFDTSGR